MSLAALAVGAIAVLVGCSAPTTPEPWQVGRVSDFPPGSVYRITVHEPRYEGGPPASSTELFVANVDGELTALPAAVPDDGCLMRWLPEEQLLISPCHGEMYAASGLCMRNCEGNLPTIELIVDGDMVYFWPD